MQNEAGVPVGRRRAKRLATWRAIRAAAIELTDELGWDAVSIDRVAERADVSTRTVFNYFRTKDAMIFEPDPETGANLRAFIASLPAGTSLWSGLEAMVREVLSTDPAKLATVGQLFRDQPALFHTASGYYAGLQHEVADAFHERLPNGTPPIVAHAASAAALGVMTAAVTEWNSATGLKGLHELAQAGFGATSSADLRLEPNRTH